MKSRIIILASVLLGSSMLLTSFDMETEGSGSVTVTASFDGQGIPETLVGISTSEENLENSVYVHEELTNDQGKITFTGLAAGTYYLDADFSEEDIHYYGEGTVVVADGSIQVTIEMEEE